MKPVRNKFLNSVKKVLIILLPLFSLYPDPPFYTNVRVSDDTGGNVNQGESDFAVFKNYIYTLCNIAERASIAMIPYAWSTDTGTSFEPNIPFKDDKMGITWHTDPVIGVDDSGNVHMLIQFSIDFINHYFSRDGGQTWVDTVRVSPFDGVDKPWMIVNKNEIYIVWQQISGLTGIWFAKSTDYGRTFSAGRIWTRTGITALDMDQNEVLHLALVTGSSMYYRRSVDKGSTWSSEQFLSDVVYSSGYGDRAPINSITASGNIVFITWVDSRSGDWDIYGIRSTDAGNTWGSRFLINDITTGGQCKGWADFDPYGGLHIFYYHTISWPTNSASLWSVRYRYSDDGGATFEPSIRISDTEFRSPVDFIGDYHTIEADSNYVYALWADGRNITDNDLYFSKAPLPGVKIKEESEIVLKQNMFYIPTLWKGNVSLKIFPMENSLELALYNINGRKTLELFKGIPKSNLKISIDSDKLNKGVFFIHGSSGNYKEVKKIIRF